MACKLKIKKDKQFYSAVRKKINIDITKYLLERLYNQEKKSTRKIALDLSVGKSTIEYYLKKFKIQRRTYEEANKLHSKESNWIRGLTKESLKVARLAKSIRFAYEKKRQLHFKKIEKKFGKPLNELIKYFYWDLGLNQEQISKKIRRDRIDVIKLMNTFNIPKRPKYQYIASLKGDAHSMFGKTWEEIYGKAETKLRKKVYSERFRKIAIRRLENNEFPYFDTKIEKSMAKGLLKRRIPFVKQFNVKNKFVCDIAIPHLKIIIGCDGDYWHANPKIYTNRKLTSTQEKKVQTDKVKDKFLEKQGWTVLRFFETDIKFNISGCIGKIEKEVKSKLSEIKKIKSPIDSLSEITSL